MKRRKVTQKVAVERYAYQLLRKFNWTLEDYVRQLVRQGYRCAICRRHRDELQQDLVVDHCHVGGHVRGLLCKACNQALGLMQDNVTWLTNAIVYLEVKHVGKVPVVPGVVCDLGTGHSGG